MTPRKRQSRIYWRSQGGSRRAWGDFRDYADVGGKREPLIPEGSHRATEDSTIAAGLVAERLRALETKRRSRALGVETYSVGLEAFAAEHLEAKARAGRTSQGWLERQEFYLGRACEFFGAERELASIGSKEVERWVEHLRALAGKRGAPLRSGTVLHHLHALSNLYRRAGKLHAVPNRFNPVQDLMEKPERERTEARWLEVHEAALYLEAARILPDPRNGKLIPFAYPLVATFLLTGGRMDEVLGLQVEDVSFERKTVHFHANPFRRGKQGKTRGANRVVPLWPQLHEILGVYLVSRPPTQLLFPSPRQGTESALVDVRGALGGIARFAGLPDREITTKVFRHTYCTARLATLDRGEPVSVDTVRRELGHSNDRLVTEVYGHLGTIRHRAEVVEFRVDQHAEVLGDRLTRLRARIVTETDTAPGSPVSLSPKQEC